MFGEGSARRERSRQPGRADVTNHGRSPVAGHKSATHLILLAADGESNGLPASGARGIGYWGSRFRGLRQTTQGRRPSRTQRGSGVGVGNASLPSENGLTTSTEDRFGSSRFVSAQRLFALLAFVAFFELNSRVQNRGGGVSKSSKGGPRSVWVRPPGSPRAIATCTAVGLPAGRQSVSPLRTAHVTACCRRRLRWPGCGRSGRVGGFRGAPSAGTPSAGASSACRASTWSPRNLPCLTHDSIIGYTSQYPKMNIMFENGGGRSPRVRAVPGGMQLMLGGTP